MVNIISKCEAALNSPPPAAPKLPIIHVVAAALINANNEILIAQRPEGKPMSGLWEFPGGKMESGETPEYALMRELREELSIETRPCCMHPIAFASHSYNDFHLLMPLLSIRIWRGEIKPLEHQALKWVRCLDLHKYPMPEADIPLIATLRDLL